MVWNSQCRAGHINTYRDPSVSAFQVLELKVYTTTPNFLSKFLIKKKTQTMRRWRNIIKIYLWKWLKINSKSRNRRSMNTWFMIFLSFFLCCSWHGIASLWCRIKQNRRGSSILEQSQCCKVSHFPIKCQVLACTVNTEIAQLHYFWKYLNIRARDSALWGSDFG